MGVEWLDTFVKDVSVIDYKQLTLEEIKKDTETVTGEFYQLPKGRLLWIKLWSDTINGGVEWATFRPYTAGKLEYYTKLIGQQINIEMLKR